MSDIDERVVEMKFNNAQFESGVKTSVSSLDKLKQGLNLDGASKSLSGLQDVADRFHLGGIADGVDTIAGKFSALGIAGVSALATISSQAVMVGENLLKSLTIDPVKAGLDEYNTNLNSVQTILSNTQSSGAKLSDVNSALNQLNHYSDQTIYNFSEMAKNIGTFTAAGVGLKPAVASIKGIANLAALSGSNSEQASTAMYQLSQAISAGKVGLQDWNSVVNAGMGGTVFQRALAKTAVNMGTLKDSALKLTGPMKNVSINGESFRNSISAAGGKGTSWLTSKVLTQTLSQFTGDLSDADLAAQGFSKSSIKAIQAQAKSAKEAATVVKTLPALIGTLQESAGSGWTQTWQYVFGDFGQAKKLFTGVNNVLGNMIQQSANARNKVLGGWEKGGGRDAGILAVKNAFGALMGILKPIQTAFRDIFPATTSAQLISLTKGFEVFTAQLQNGVLQYAPQIGRTFKGVFAVLDIGRMIIVQAVKTFLSLFGVMGNGGAGILDITANIGDFLVKVRDAIKNGDGLAKIFELIGSVLKVPITFISSLVGLIGSLVSGIANVKFDAFDGAGKKLSPLNEVLKALSAIADKVRERFAGIAKAAGPVIAAVGQFIGSVAKNIVDGVKNINWDTALTAVQTGFFGALTVLVGKFIKGNRSGEGFKFDIGGDGLFGSVKEMFEGLTGQLKAMQNNLKSKTLLNIAVAVGILTIAMVALATIDSKRLIAASGAMGVMFGELAASMKLMDIIASGGNISKIPAMAAGMILLSIAINILASAVKKLASLDWNELARGLTGVVVLIGAVVIAAKSMGGETQKNLITTGLALIPFAIGIRILAGAVASMAALSLGGLAKGLIGVAGVLVSVALFQKFAAAGKDAITNALGLLVFAAALKVLASAISDFATLGGGNMAGALALMAISLAAVGAALRVMPDNMLISGVALLAVASSLKIMGSALETFGSFSPDEIAKSLIVLGGALGIIAIALTLMGDPVVLLGAAALLIAAAALNVLAPALAALGSMDMDTIGKSLGVLAASLGILALSLTAMIVSLPGAAALLVAAAALTILAPAMAALGAIPLASIGTALLAMVGTFVVLGLAGLALAAVVPVLLLLGAAILLLGGGVALAGTGVLALAGGLAALGALGAAGIAIAIVAIQQFLDAIPGLADSFAKAIISMVNAVGDSAPAMVSAGVKIITALLTAINSVVPKIVKTAITIISSFLDAIGVLIPKVVTTGLKIINGVLAGIAQNIGGITTNAIKIVVNFINAIAGRLPSIIQAGVNLVLKFVNGLSTAIDNNSAKMGTAGGKLAVAIIHGMVNGINAGLSQVIGAAAGIGGAALEAVKHILGIHSPSKEMYKLGEFTAEGFAQGLESGTTADVQKAYSDMGDQLKDTIDSTTTAIADYQDKITTLTQTQLDDAKAIQDAQDKLKQAQEDQIEGKAIKDAQDKLEDLTQARKDDQKAVEDGQKALDKAQKDWLNQTAVKEAQEKLSDAQEQKRDDQRAARKAKADLRDAKTTDIRDAKKAIADAKADEADTKRDAADAKSDLASAKAKDAKTDSEKRAKDKAVREATEKVSDSQRKIDDAKQKVKDTQADLKTAQTTGISDAQEALSDANETVSDDTTSIEGYTQALKDAQDAQKNKTGVTDAQDKLDKLTRTRDKDNESIVEAQKALDDAKAKNAAGKDVSDAQDALDKLIRTRDKDVQSLADAQAGLAEATDDNTKATAAYQELTVALAAQEAQLESLSDQYKVTDDALTDANKNLDDATKARDDYNKSIQDQYGALADIDEQTKLPDYFANMQDQIAKTIQFTSELQQLRSRGLNDQSYKEFLGKGLDAMPFVTQLLDSGQQGISDLNSLTTQLGTAAGSLGSDASNQLYQAGVDAAAGLVQGLQAQKAAIQAQMNEIGSAMVQAIKDQLGIHSPSREFAKVGGYSMDGLAQGLSQSSRVVEIAASDVGTTALTALQQSMTGMYAAVSDNLDMNPTIRPVLDLSSVQQGAGLIGGMLTPPQLNVDGTYSSAVSASDAYQANQDQLIAAKTAVATAPSAPVTYNQYNNSPKALSQAEIYRQTKNQLSVAKGD